MALTAPPSALEEDRVIELAHSVYLRGRQNSQSQGCHMLNGTQEREPCSAQDRKHRTRKQKRKQTHATPTTDPAGQTGAAAEPGKTRTVSSLQLINSSPKGRTVYCKPAAQQPKPASASVHRRPRMCQKGFSTSSAGREVLLGPGASSKPSALHSLGCSFSCRCVMQHATSLRCNARAKHGSCARLRMDTLGLRGLQKERV